MCPTLFCARLRKEVEEIWLSQVLFAVSSALIYRGALGKLWRGRIKSAKSAFVVYVRPDFFSAKLPRAAALTAAALTAAALIRSVATSQLVPRFNFCDIPLSL